MTIFSFIYYVPREQGLVFMFLYFLQSGCVSNKNSYLIFPAPHDYHVFVFFFFFFFSQVIIKFSIIQSKAMMLTFNFTDYVKTAFKILHRINVILSLYLSLIISSLQAEHQTSVMNLNRSNFFSFCLFDLRHNNYSI